MQSRLATSIFCSPFTVMPAGAFGPGPARLWNAPMALQQEVGMLMRSGALENPQSKAFQSSLRLFAPSGAGSVLQGMQQSKILYAADETQKDQEPQAEQSKRGALEERGRTTINHDLFSIVDMPLGIESYDGFVPLKPDKEQ